MTQNKKGDIYVAPTGMKSQKSTGTMSRKSIGTMSPGGDDIPEEHRDDVAGGARETVTTVSYHSCQ